ncbi:MAG: hypothetical protein ACYDHH_00820 [Solirubrobacteraceae bacterium]
MSTLFVDINGAVDTLDSGVVPIKITLLVGPVDPQTDAIQLQLPLGTAQPPGPNASYSATAQLLPPAGCDQTGDQGQAHENDNANNQCGDQGQHDERGDLERP